MTFLQLTRRVGESLRFTGSQMPGDSAILLTVTGVSTELSTESVASEMMAKLSSEYGGGPFSPKMKRSMWKLAFAMARKLVGEIDLPKISLRIEAPDWVTARIWDAESEIEKPLERVDGAYECILTLFDEVVFGGRWLDTLGEFSVTCSEPGRERRVGFEMQLPREIDVIRDELGRFIPPRRRALAVS